MISTLNAYTDAEYVAQNYIDAAAAQPFSQSSEPTDFLDPPAADLPLSMPLAQQADSTLQPSINAPIMEELYDFSEIDNYPWSLMPDDTNSTNADYTYHCYNEVQLANETRELVPIAPKLPVIEQGTTTSEMLQSRSLNNPTPLVSQKKRRRYDEEGREKAKRVRRLGACFRCKIYKLPVDRLPHSIHSMTDVCIVQRRTPMCKLSQGQKLAKDLSGALRAPQH